MKEEVDITAIKTSAEELPGCAAETDLKFELGAHPESDEQPIAKQLALLAIPTFGQLIAEPAFILIDISIV